MQKTFIRSSVGQIIKTECMNKRKRMQKKAKGLENYYMRNESGRNRKVDRAETKSWKADKRKGGSFKDNKDTEKRYQEKADKKKDYKAKDHKAKDYKAKEYKAEDLKEKDFREKSHKEKIYNGKSNKQKEDNRKGYRGKEHRDQEYQEKKRREKEDKRNNTRKKEHTKSCKERICPAASKCGGCQYQGVPYEEQLTRKQKEVEKLLKEYGKVNKILGMENPYHYRNKAHAVFARKKTGQVISGFYEEGTHRVVPVDSCMIEDVQADAIIVTIRELVKSFRIRIYNEDTGFGLLRHVLIRKGFTSGEIMVVLVLSSPILPSKNNFVKALRKLHPEISTVVLNVNARQTSMVLGDRKIVLYGKGYIEDRLCGCVFKISPGSFYQVNPVQTEVLYGTAIEYAGLTGKEKVLDAYCGIGTIGLIAAKHAAQVIGVELNKDAVKDAVGNAKRNQITNAKFCQGDAGAFMTRLAEEKEPVDVVFMDPPRAGSDEAFLSSVVRLAPKKVVYISCNPETQARDLEYLVKKGYAVKKIQPVDMFAFSGHVETVALLVRKS